MNDLTPEINFPVDWTYRIICENRANIEDELKVVMENLGEHNFHKGNLSKTEKYITFKVIKKGIKNLEELRNIPNYIKEIEGVKQIL
ncbi:MAG: DUF493 family protein [Lentisphaeria bacterium]|nr:DUF493 family protein [Lentisphaeria bacterium]